jgi:hypothetical protein
VGGRRLGESKKVLAVRGCEGHSLVLAGPGESFGGKLADGLEQPVADGCPGWFRHDQALVHERAQHVGDVGRFDVAKAPPPLAGLAGHPHGGHRSLVAQCPWNPVTVCDGPGGFAVAEAGGRGIGAGP